ncbi:MAG: hypothetical protein C5B52_09840 [Bacteroidetes bacterium]|nr:MAG: hypothetical protein C5B52_09840 [Bacteroidota bacterium]
MKLIGIFTFSWIFLMSSQMDCFGQTNQSGMKRIASSPLQSDFKMLRDSLQKFHPGIYRYRSQKELNRIFDSCFNSIKDSMTIPEFYALTSYAIASMEDGHSNCRLPRLVADEFMSNAGVFPAMILFINAHAYIYCCKENPTLSGNELLSINNQPLDKIIQKLFSFIPSDAGISSRKNWELPEYFHLLYYVVFGDQKEFAITYRSADGQTGKTMLHSDNIRNIFCNNPFPQPDQFLTFSYRSGNIAVLQIKTFFDGFLERTGENFEKFLDSAFNDIKKKGTKKLLIDIRRNQGGNDGNGALLYSYLTANNFSYYKSLESSTKKFTKDDHAQLQIQMAQKNNFSGKVYILTDGRSFSASSEFASIAKTNQRAIFLGEENGGGYYGNTSGNDLSLVLPNSQISCRIPLVKYTVDVKNLPNGIMGVIPDYPLYPSITDIIEKKDHVLDRSIQIMQSHQFH